MISTTLSDNRKSRFFSIYKWSLRKNLATFIVYTAILLLTYPVFLTLFNSIAVYPTDMLKNSGDGGTSSACVMSLVFVAVVGFIAMLFTLIIGVFMFSYMHRKRSVDVFGALPVTRRTLFFARYAAGLTMLAVPLILVTVISTVLLSYSNVAVWWTVNHAINILLSVIVSYTFTAFVALSCGTTADTVVSVLALCGMYPGVIGIIQFFSGYIIPGVQTALSPSSVVYTALSPFVSGITNAYINIYNLCAGESWSTLFYADENGINHADKVARLSIFDNPEQLIWWLVFGAALFIGCCLLSKRRKAETAQNGFALKAIPVIIRVVATTACGLLFAVIFSSVQSGFTAESKMMSLGSSMTTFAWFMVGLVVGSFIAHLVLTLIYNRGTRGFLKSLIPYGITVLVIAAGYIILSTGLFGADVQVPDKSEVASASVSINGNSTDFNSPSDKERLAGFNDVKDIDKVLDIHKAIANNLRECNPYPYSLSVSDGGLYYNEYMPLKTISIEYKLKNGSTMNRTYSLMNITDGNGKICDEIVTAIDKLLCEESYKKDVLSLFKYRVTSVFFYQCTPQWAIDYAANVDCAVYSKDAEKIVNALKRDILEDEHYIENAVERHKKFNEWNNEETGEKEKFEFVGISVYCSKYGDPYGEEVYEEHIITPEYKNTWKALKEVMTQNTDSTADEADKGEDEVQTVIGSEVTNQNVTVGAVG